MWPLLLLACASVALGQGVYPSPPPLTPGEAQALLGPEPWLADRLDFCACFAQPVDRLDGASCIEFVQDYAALWDRYLVDAAFQTCLGPCPCGVNVTECFDVLGCADPGCEGVSRACYTGPGGTLGVGLCAAGTETCLNGTSSGCVGETLPAPEQCDGLDHDCDGFALNGFNLTADPLNCGACGNVCINGSSCENSTCVCPANEGDCGGGACQTLVDDANCGACGLVCNATLAGSTCQLIGSPVCACTAPLADCGGGFCTDTLADPLNCGACNVTVDDGNECTVDYCNGTVVNDAAAADGFNCTLGGGFGVCAAGNCTQPPGTVLSFSRTTTSEAVAAPQFTFTIETTFINDPTANLTIWDLGVMPYFVGVTPSRTIGQYFDPTLVNATGDCTINPDWANFAYPDSGYYPLTKEERLVTDPIALVTPGSGLASCTIVAVVSAENAFVEEQYGLCLPFLDNTTLTSGEAQFRIDNVSVATDSSSWTRCPYGGHHTIDVTGQEAGPLNVNIVTTFIQRRLANDVLLVMDVTGGLPLSGCAAVNASSADCYIDAGATYVMNAGIFNGAEGLWTGTNALATLPGDTPCTVAYNCLFSSAPSFDGTLPTFVASRPLDTNPLQFLSYVAAGPLYEYVYQDGASNSISANSTTISVGPNCADGIANQDETGVDCGGSRCIPCQNTFPCNVPGDCIGGACILGACSTIG